MIVETSSMTKCGEGTPMFSRLGRSTNNLFKATDEKKHSDVKITLRKNVKLDEIDSVLEMIKVSLIIYKLFNLYREKS